MIYGYDILQDDRPNDLLRLASGAEVYERVGEITQYAIAFAEDIAAGDLPLLTETAIGPDALLSILAPGNLGPECLVKGPVTSQRISLVHGGEGSSVTVIGGDAALLMDRQVKSEVWSNMMEGTAAIQIFSSYGFLPNVQINGSMYLENRHSLVQRATDYRFLRQMARRNSGFVQVTADRFGIFTGNFVRPQLELPPAADLVINQRFNNISNLSISWDVDRPHVAAGAQINLGNLQTISAEASGAEQLALGNQRLSGIAAKRDLSLSTPLDDSGNMQQRLDASLAEADWFIRATCRTSLRTLGTLVRPNTVVNLAGAGSRHSGKYYVMGVRHLIDNTAHIMELELARNGWES